MRNALAEDATRGEYRAGGTGNRRWITVAGKSDHSLTHVPNGHVTTPAALDISAPLNSEARARWPYSHAESAKAAGF